VVKKYHEEKLAALEPIDPQHESLLPRLRPYQKLAVRWMLSMEKKRAEEKGKVDLHPLYQEVKTLEGSTFYYNDLGGFLVKEKPLAIPSSPGGILADEMGLGKTVEILSLMLCHPREGVSKPEWLEPVKMPEKMKKKTRRHRRSPSPVEFVLDDKETEELKEEANNTSDVETFQNVSNNASVNGANGPRNVDVTPLSNEQTFENVPEDVSKGNENGHKEDGSSLQVIDKDENDSVNFQDDNEQPPFNSEEHETINDVDNVHNIVEENIMQADGNDSDETSDEDYIPRPSKSRRGLNSLAKVNSVEPTENSSSDEESDSNPSSDEEVEETVYEPRPSTSRRRTREASPQPSTSRSGTKKEYPQLNTSRKGKVTFASEVIVNTPKNRPKTKEKAKSILKTTKVFDPSSVLNGKTVTSKSPLQDILLQAVITLDKTGTGASQQSIKKHMATVYGKSNVKNINKGIVRLVEIGLLINTSPNCSGANGSFMINPDFENFDSRGLMAKQKLDKIDHVIEVNPNISINVHSIIYLFRKVFN